MYIPAPKWYVAWTKPKHEHIAAANLIRNLQLEVFFPRLQFKKATRSGMREVTEPLFPGYLFVRCQLEERGIEIQHVGGVNRLVQFGDRIPAIPDLVIEELQRHFQSGKVVVTADPLLPGDEVTVTHGAFAGMCASVLRNVSAKKRVQILLEILGRPAMVEVDRHVVTSKRNTMADLVPFLAADSSWQQTPACRSRI